MPRSTTTAISGCGSICSEPSRTVALINNVGRSADAISSSSLTINLNICPLSPSPAGLLQTHRLTEGRGDVGRRNTLQSHPSDTREISRSVTATGLLGPLMVTDRDIRSTFHRLVSICNNYELKQPLNVTDRDKTSQRPYHWHLHSSANSTCRGIPASLIFSISFPGFLSSSNVNRSTLCPSLCR